tara:strand:+ start:2531 stop:2797 length:267 start_codon:yes stop_codon:yes gene_type:complete
MKTKEMIELVRQHHPHMGEKEIVRLLNRAKDEFCERTDIYKKTDVSITTTADTRWYTVPTGLLKIEGVFLNDVRIPRLQGNPIINDES